MIQKITDAETRPQVTVLVTTRNMEAQIRGCLSGLMEQTIADRMEVIVLDQGSEQCEWAVIADLQRRHHNLISLRLPAAAGSAPGIDLALKMASGKYITILSATDRIDANACQRLAAALDERPDAVLADAAHPLWRRELHDSVGGFGDTASFVLRVAQRFPIVRLQEGTGAETNVPSPEGGGLGRGNHAGTAAPAAPAAAAAPADPDQALAQLAASTKGDDRQQAVRLLEQHLEKFPDHAIAHNNLAAVCYQLGDADKALLHYRRATQLAPAETTYRKNLADLLYMEGIGVDESIAIYLELLKQSPRDVETLLNIGIICEGVGRPNEAESFYLTALEIEPRNQAVRDRMAELHAKESETMERPAAAYPTVETAQERYQRAQAMVEQGDQEGAVRELEAIVGAFPDFSPAHNDLAVLSYQSGAKEKALFHYEKAAALAPENGIFQKNLADFYFVERRDVDGAIGIYLEQLRREPTDVETLMNLGNICVALDRPQEAETFYGKVAQLEPWNMAARECLSNVRSCVNG